MRPSGGESLMIAFLSGTLEAKSPEAAFVDVAGVGYEVLMSQKSLSKLPDVGQSVHVFTYLQVNEGGIALFGFLSDDEKAVFEQLISVSGVGSKVALSALSTFDPRALADAVAAKDIAAISRIPGVGKKTASRIILELAGWIDQGLADMFDEPDASKSSDAAVRGASEALISMGFTLTEADHALAGAPQDASEATVLQYALKRLGS